MGKKKHKQPPTLTDGSITKKNDVTAFEAAFKEAKKKAELKKKIESTELKSAHGSAQLKTIASGPSTAIPLQTKKQAQPALPNNTPITGTFLKGRQQNTTKPSHSASEKARIKQGIKPIPDNSMVLELDNSKSEQQSGIPLGKSQRGEKLGRSQVHSEKFKDECDIVIGFDFGTSSSKVIIRDSGRQTAYAIPFGSLACADNKYLIPTRILINNYGIISLSGSGYLFSNLKVHLMDNPEQHIFEAAATALKITASELAAAYMAQVIRIARDWFLKQQESVYRKTHIHWHINVGLPSQNYNDQKMRRTFCTIAMAAWRLSLLNAEVCIGEVKENILQAQHHIATEGKNINAVDQKSDWLHPDFVNTHPEVIMEIVGYSRSPLRTSGLHLLIDIGATTVDIATFIIHEKGGEDLYPLLETRVERLGTMMLHNNRMSFLKNHLEKILVQMNLVDSTKRLPEIAHYELQIKQNLVFDNDAIFFKECYEKIGEVIKKTKKDRDPNSPAWKLGLPVFICGGGRRLSSYYDMICGLGSRLAGLTGCNGFDIKNIPVPSQLHASEITVQDYDRLAVAYGLSFSVDEIGEIIPESMVGNIPQKQKKRRIENLFVTKDMC